MSDAVDTGMNPLAFAPTAGQVGARGSGEDGIRTHEAV